MNTKHLSFHEKKPELLKKFLEFRNLTVVHLHPTLRVAHLALVPQVVHEVLQDLVVLGLLILQVDQVLLLDRSVLGVLAVLFKTQMNSCVLWDPAGAQVYDFAKSF